MSSGGAATRALVAVGSNIEPERHLPLALRELATLGELLALSRVWETAPVDAPGTPSFLNAAVLLTTALPPLELRRRLREAEARLGRRRGPDANAPRTIDLDLALVEGVVLDDRQNGLRLPDPALTKWPHVGYPAGEAAPQLEHPLERRRLGAIGAGLGPPGEPRDLPGWELPSAAGALPPAR